MEGSFLTSSSFPFLSNLNSEEYTEEGKPCVWPRGADQRGRLASPVIPTEDNPEG